MQPVQASKTPLVAAPSVAAESSAGKDLEDVALDDVEGGDDSGEDDGEMEPSGEEPYEDTDRMMDAFIGGMGVGDHSVLVEEEAPASHTYQIHIGSDIVRFLMKRIAPILYIVFYASDNLAYESG